MFKLTSGNILKYHIQGIKIYYDLVVSIAIGDNYK